MLHDSAGHAASALVDPTRDVPGAFPTVATRKARFTSENLCIEGLLHAPAERAGDRRPAVVLLHGGPSARDRLEWNALVQLIVGSGFTVLQVNYRGSAGYGDAFEHLNVRDVGGGDARDVAAAARWLQDMPGIDGTRLICVGGSYGGYLVYRQLTRYSDLWAAGIAWMGITDWTSLYYETTDAVRLYCRALFGGGPSELPQMYMEASPIHDVARLTAPILMIHGKNDPRVPVTQARRFRDRLLELGRHNVCYVELDEGHGLTARAARIRMYKKIAEFLHSLL
ncbi:alpha/beta hydrolase family protein [Limnochorda pilosa]